jgi:hypothetical protein
MRGEQRSESPRPPTDNCHTCAIEAQWDLLWRGPKVAGNTVEMFKGDWETGYVQASAKTKGSTLLRELDQVSHGGWVLRPV